MATYAIGDVQGCFGALVRLLDAIAFEPARDRLWMTGDLVNRGPDSLAVLRWARDHESSIVAVLGNHDLHLLAIDCGVRVPKRLDTIADVLAAPDREPLLAWLRRRPILHVEGDRVLVHAGLHPRWAVARAREFARELEAALAGPGSAAALADIYAHTDQPWQPTLRGARRLGALTSVFTRLRVCRADGTADYGFSATPAEAPEGYMPWFEVPGRASADHTVVFGHWSALGLRLAPGIVATDTGCVWGRSLTAVRLEDNAVFQVTADG